MTVLPSALLILVLAHLLATLLPEIAHGSPPLPHGITLFKGYSMMPSAPAAFRRGMS